MKKVLEILHDIRPEFDFANSENFIEDGYIDSFDLVNFVAMLEKEFGIKIKGTEIVPENFFNLAAVENLLKVHGVKDEI